MQNGSGRDSLVAAVNRTCTPMGTRFLRTNLIQPSTSLKNIHERHESIKGKTIYLTFDFPELMNQYERLESLRECKLRLFIP